MTDKPIRRFQRPEWGRENNPTKVRALRGQPTPHAEGADEQWLTDAPARSASILERLGGGTTDPSPPSGGGGLDLVTTGAQLKDALETYANECRVGQLDGRSIVELDQTILIQQHTHDGTPWGVNGNYAKVLWTGPGGLDMLVFQGVEGIYNRCLTIEKLYLYGNGYAAPPARSCLKLYAPAGDPGCLYKFKLDSIYTSDAEFGFIIEGAVFEGIGTNLHAENHRGDGMLMLHTHEVGKHQGIVSNIMLIHPNMSRNLGAGIRCTNSTNIIFGSFILNGQGGVVGPEGLRAFIASNGENTGESLLVVPTPGWGSQINGNEASTDGQTVARYYDGSLGWQDIGQPMLYLLDDAGSNVPQQFNHMSYYGDGTNQGKVAVVKP